ncbi:dihydrolipoyl dehydrogenase [Edwardsiella hoshinae]|uniref:Dihydrolipoyl dehydrogenase n=1 Tax=Edwardsiella hoshinae TaxID=93378 RepID=A0A376DN75_9GAMM|nr:dihydrolipoyl dehydrogenase [Edwardsiella hoshinae]QPR28742.1 dihydrolipoyl dehydrogenase [Edwardsiella hoshinae]STC92283.1 Dihydrolipoyl dehydrogenase [Edwardsiella hoshinae]
MKKLSVDVAVIGGGTAGLGAYRAAKRHTPHVVMIEGGPFGTTCARVGCMPSKLLIAAAEAAHQIARAPGFGVHPQGAPRIAGREVMDRVKRERDRFVGFVMEGVERIPAEDKILGYARFLDDHTLQVDEHTRIHAQRIVIASGSRPIWPAAWNALGDRLIVNDDLFAWDTLPRAIAVFGPGVIGLELGQALHRLGVTVKVFGIGGAVGPLTDDVLRHYATTTLGKEFYLDPDAHIDMMQREGEQVLIRYRDRDDQMQTCLVDYVLAATGRRPNVDNLGLENTHLQRDTRGVPIADPLTMQTSVAHVFIAGDASNQLPLLHEASDQARIAGDNAGRYPQVVPGLRRSAISVVFSDPQIAMVGATFRELNESYGACGCFAVGEASFEDQGRSRVMLRNQGKLHVYGEQGSGRFLGAEMIGPDAEHIAHLLAWAHQQQMTIDQMLDMPFYHPVIEEGLRTALRDLQSKLRLGDDEIERCLRCPGE